jgi:hypothetical protein
MAGKMRKYDIEFVVIVVSVAVGLFWWWVHDTDRKEKARIAWEQGAAQAGKYPVVAQQNFQPVQPTETSEQRRARLQAAAAKLDQLNGTMQVQPQPQQQAAVIREPVTVEVSGGALPRDPSTGLYKCMEGTKTVYQGYPCNGWGDGGIKVGDSRGVSLVTQGERFKLHQDAIAQAQRSQPNVAQVQQERVTVDVGGLRHEGPVAGVCVRLREQEQDIKTEQRQALPASRQDYLRQALRDVQAAYTRLNCNQHVSN